MLKNKYKDLIKVDTKYSTWGFTLNKITFGSHNFIVNEYVYFDVKYNSTIVPFYFLNFQKM